jgi:hypothetical protein
MHYLYLHLKSYQLISSHNYFIINFILIYLNILKNKIEKKKDFTSQVVNAINLS